MLDIPFEPIFFGVNINVHLILEYLAFFIGFRYYVYLKKKNGDYIHDDNRLSIIIGAAIGAFIGSRLIGILENPLVINDNVINLLSMKTIMGGLFFGMLGVELTKKIIKEKKSSGDLFTFPLIIAIIIGRLGCFLSGTNEFTYGIMTHSFLGMDLGDNIPRHPITLYEIVFLIILFHTLKSVKNFRKDGDSFRWFIISYFAFRFFIEFLKPNTFYILGLSTIQLLCIVCIFYYRKTITNYLNAH